MKFKDLFTNIMGSTIVIVIIIYLFTDWFFSFVTGQPNYSHFIDMFFYPIIGLVWMFISGGKPFTKFVIWTNRIVFFVLIVITVMFYRNISEGVFIPSDKEVTEITENNTKCFIQISDTLTYYIDKNIYPNYDTVSYDSWEVYRFVREDMFKDTIFGSYYLGDGESFLHLNYIQTK